MNCEVCGRETPSPQEVSIEGARLQVCSRCASLGQPIRKTKSSDSTSAPLTTISSTRRRNRPPSSPHRFSRSRRPRRELVPVENFSQLIRTARVEQGMSQQDVAQRINERASVIGKLESGKMSVATIKLARKLERLFKLTLLEAVEPLDLSPSSESSKATLGDVVEIRRKKPKP